tara:strand:- start:2013 stop:3641 length:1629 start_codon:yes stop_codon:yes gene_type:complete
MALDPSIALGVRPLQLPDPLAQMAQVSQIQASQRQNEMAQQQQQLNKMKIEELIADRQELNDFALKLKDTGITPRKYMEMLRSSRDPVKQEKGMEGLMRLDEQEKFDAYLARQAKPAGATMPTGAPSMMRQPVAAPAAPTQDMLGTGMYGMAPTAPMNALAASTGVSPQPSVNALAAPQSRLADLEARFREVSRFTAPGAKAEADRLKDQIKQLQSVYVVPNVGLVSGAGQTIVASGMAPTEIKKLTSERDSLPAGDPRRKVYDQAIADLGAANRNAEARLRFDQAKFSWEKANPTMSIQEDPSGLLAVNTRTGVATPVVYGPTGFQAAPAATPGTSMMRQPPAALPGQRTPAIPGMSSVLDRTAAPAAMPLTAQGGERMPGMPVAGKEKTMTETQSNATAYGMRMKEANSILEDLSKKGVLKGAVIEATPLIGGALGQALPSVLGGTSAAQQQVNQAKSNFITAVLRKESGAVISDSEFDREDKKYFPQINDNASVIKQKENARKLAIKAIEVQAGPGAKEIQKYQPSVGGGVDTSNPLLR